MANFVAIYDPVDTRRMAFEEKCNQEIAIFDDLKQAALTVQDFTILWAANKNAPIDTYKNDSQAAIIFGDAILPGSDERASAKSISREWSDTQNAQQNFYDGYYCIINYSVEKGFVIGGDILGLFPIYYYSDGEVTIAASSPELFRYHQSFTPKLCVEGLTGILLTMHSVDGLTLWKDVCRLQAGYLLAGRAGKKPREILQYKLPLSNKYYDLPFSHQIELIHKRMGEAVSRHAPANQAYSFLFSGGLDTRMLAGYLKKGGNDITAITFGKSSDQEMKIAKKAVRALPFRHISANRTFDNYADYANLSARWEHGLHGFNSIHSWGYKPYLEEQEAPRVISGIYHDGVFSSNFSNLIREDESLEEIFSKILSKSTEWGISPGNLDYLLINKSLKNNIENITDTLRDRFYRFSDSDYQRTWCYELMHSRRFHLGGAIWKMSFGAWPVIPIIDSAVLEIMAGLPSAATSERRAQRQLVATYFPDLARIALDNNSNSSEPLIPTWQFLLRKAATKPLLIKRVAESIKRRLYGPWDENLYYHRIYNVNNAGWQSVRSEAEPGRSLTRQLFDQQKLLQLVPSPDEKIDRKLNKASGTKSLLGFFLWLRMG